MKLLSSKHIKSVVAAGITLAVFWTTGVVQAQFNRTNQRKFPKNSRFTTKPMKVNTDKKTGSLYRQHFAAFDRSKLSPTLTNEMSSVSAIRNSELNSTLSSQHPNLGDCFWVIDAIDRLGVYDHRGNGPTSNDASWTPPPGFVILNNRVTVWSSNSGYHSVSTLPPGSNILITRNQVNREYDKWKSKLQLAGLGRLVAQLEQERQRELNIVSQYASSHHVLAAMVHAESGAKWPDNYRAWQKISVDAQICYVGTEADLQQRLARKYADVKGMAPATQNDKFLNRGN